MYLLLAVDAVAVATEHLVRATWFLAQITVGLALATLFAVAVPIVLRYLDVARETRSARRQWITILHLLEVPVKSLIQTPLSSADLLVPATENLMDRSLEADMARALPIGTVDEIYLSVVQTYRTIHEAKVLQEYHSDIIASIRDLESQKRQAAEAAPVTKRDAEIRQIEDSIAKAKRKLDEVIFGIRNSAELSQKKLGLARMALGSNSSQAPRARVVKPR